MNLYFQRELVKTGQDEFKIHNDNMKQGYMQVSKYWDHIG